MRLQIMGSNDQVSPLRLCATHPVFPSVQRLLCKACHLLLYASGLSR